MRRVRPLTLDVLFEERVDMRSPTQRADDRLAKVNRGARQIQSRLDRDNDEKVHAIHQGHKTALGPQKIRDRDRDYALSDQEADHREKSARKAEQAKRIRRKIEDRQDLEKKGFRDSPLDTYKKKMVRKHGKIRGGLRNAVTSVKNRLGLLSKRTADLPD